MTYRQTNAWLDMDTSGSESPLVSVMDQIGLSLYGKACWLVTISLQCPPSPSRLLVKSLNAQARALSSSSASASLITCPNCPRVFLGTSVTVCNKMWPYSLARLLLTSLPEIPSILRYLNECYHNTSNFLINTKDKLKKIKSIKH